MMRSHYLHYCLPSIGEEEINEVIETLKSGWITTGEKSHLFEKNFSLYLNSSKKCLALNSCTAALHLALILLGIKPGDEVITTPYTFIATTNAIEYVGAKPVFVDIEKDTLNINPDLILKKINSKTKAILIVHYGGHACEMDKLLNISQQHRIPLIEDAAHAISGSYYGQAIGTFGKFSAFSFYANKNITTIEGGMLVGDENEIDLARIYSLHGINRDAWKRYREEGDWHYEVIYPGLKYNMTDISASLGIHQLAKIHEFHKKRQWIAAQYHSAFREIPALEIPVERRGVQHGWFNYNLRLNLNKIKISQAQFIEQLNKYKIGTTVHFIPVHLHPYYKNKYHLQSDDFPNAYQQFQRGICLPLYPKMSENDVIDVIQAVSDIVTTYKNYE